MDKPRTPRVRPTLITPVISIMIHPARHSTAQAHWTRAILLHLPSRCCNPSAFPVFSSAKLHSRPSSSSNRLGSRDARRCLSTSKSKRHAPTGFLWIHSRCNVGSLTCRPFICVNSNSKSLRRDAHPSVWVLHDVLFHGNMGPKSDCA